MRRSWLLTALFAFVTAARSLEAQGPVSFASFIEIFGRSYKVGSSEYQDRQALFEERAREVWKHNERPDRRWSAAINEFSDRSDVELARLRGWRRRGSPSESARHGRSAVVSLGQIREGRAPVEKVNWSFLNTSKHHHNQGSCGSCWAIASAELLEAHSEIHSASGTGRSFSAQELVNCVPNPRHCGGTGGCEGATIELAMEWVMKRGLAEERDVPYVAADESCRDQPAQGSSLLQISDRARVQTLQGGIGDLSDHLFGAISNAISLGEASAYSQGAATPAAQFGMTSWERLPENKYEPLLDALQNGPVGVSVSASSWFSYSRGIFDKCVKDAVIDHAVLLIGYGQDDAGTGYWLVKNSWGTEWGEYGLMRLLRRESEGEHCGIDHQPELGSGCEGGPSEVTVCGTCGILYDTVVPHFVEHENSKVAREQALVLKH